MLFKVSRTTVASRTIFFILAEVVSLWMARRNEKETAGLENMSLAYLVLIVEISLKQPYPTKTWYFCLFTIHSQK